MSQITVDDLGYPIARTGAPAAVQYLTAFNSGTRTYTGNKSRAVYTKFIGATQTVLNGFYTFYVTPDSGDPYRVYMSEERVVTPGSTVTVYIEYPWIILAHIYLESAEFSPYPSSTEDFQSYTTGDYFQLPSSGAWNTPIIFSSVPVNTDCWDDFENYASATTGEESTLLQLDTGYAWAGAGKFNASSDTECYDDFEGYAAAATYTFNQGLGWSGLGMTDTSFGLSYADDDYESYATGAITSLDGGTGAWFGDGEFA